MSTMTSGDKRLAAKDDEKPERWVSATEKGFTRAPYQETKYKDPSIISVFISGLVKSELTRVNEILGVVEQVVRAGRSNPRCVLASIARVPILPTTAMEVMLCL